MDDVIRGSWIKVEYWHPWKWREIVKIQQQMQLNDRIYNNNKQDDQQQQTDRPTYNKQNDQQQQQPPQHNQNREKRPTKKH